ncbi:receptor-like protein kinase FERONIA [Hibiscus syriacus]|uniref:receptor-like protein kinase FERONIA n=1 Tax=Hibiscus syriacus TaxID=106335 RepID=UPI0019249FCF|nr:receptor-like protein kinase FERONIA [Hibiscus syriacus]
MRNPLFSILCFCRASESKLKKIKHRTTKGNGKSSLPQHLYRRFSLDEIRAATDNFDCNLVLGKGGSGVVYKGFFDDGASVLAVKRLMGSSILEDFRNEVQLLCQQPHQHLVSLIGFCDAGDEKIVVVDYMTQGSLFDHLHGIRQDPLTWKQRLEICIGAARGLHYLHAGAKRAVIHRDIKSSNILLDDRIVSKIADFALSKIGPFSLSKAPIRIELPPLEDIDVETSRKRIFGTLGYLAPEFLHEATPTLVTDKSDVFSLGVVLLEAISGRKVIKFDVMDAATRYFLGLKNTEEWKCLSDHRPIFERENSSELLRKIPGDCFQLHPCSGA